MWISIKFDAKGTINNKRDVLNLLAWRRTVIIWTNDGQFYIDTSLGLNELNFSGHL